MIAHLDCSTGISGDKFLGALLDAGLSEESLRETLARLGVPESALLVARVRSHGIAALSVALDPAVTAHESGQPARHLADIRALIERAGLPDAASENAIRVFELLADAEAHVHGTSRDEVHFHEVGALDVILDIVGVAFGIEALGIDTLIATPPALGGGTVTTSHGVLPVPAPATVRLLLGVPTEPGVCGAEAGELTTPTGAALLRAFTSGYGPTPALTPHAIGYGAGTRDIGVPNIARIIVGEPLAAATGPGGRAGDDANSASGHGPLAVEDVCVLETNIDHLTPEQLAFCAEELLHDGALDTWQAPIVMKKGRLAVALSLMCAPEDAERLGQRMHALTGTLGVRRSDITRTVAHREEWTVETRLGPVRVKLFGTDGTRDVRPEYEELARLARETGRPIAQLARDLAAEVAEALKER